MATENTKTALVENAADPKQVRSARNTQKFAANRDKDDIRFIMDTPQGRRFVCRLLAEMRVNNTVIGATDAETNQNAGRQDSGHKILSWIVEAAEDQYFISLREAQKEKTQ